MRTIKLCATPGPRPTTLLEAIRRAAPDVEQARRAALVQRPINDRNTTTASA